MKKTLKRLGFSLIMPIFVISMVGMNIFVPHASAVSCTSLSAGDLFKVPDNSAVYLINSDLKRLYFPNSEIFHTWYDNFDNVIEIDKNCVDNYPAATSAPFGVNYRPGSRLVKLSISPSVYVVESGNIRAKITSEEVAAALYGPNWASLVRDVSDAYWPNFTATGEEIVAATPHDGMLIKISSSNKIYKIINGFKHEVVGTLGNFLAEDVRTVSQTVMDNLEDSGETTTPDEVVDNTAGGGLGDGEDNIPDEFLPQAPTLTAPASVTSGATFTISWNAFNDALFYTLEKSTNFSFSNATEDQFSNFPDLFSGSTTSSITATTYYRVKGSSNLGIGNWSNTVSVGVGCTLPSAPVLSSSQSTVNSGTSFTLSWTSITGATSYTLQKDINSSFLNGASVSLSSPTAVSATETHSVNNATNYSYRVKATNSCGDSIWSDVKTVQINQLCALPDAPVLTDPGDTKALGQAFTLSWTAVSGATSYVREYSSNTSFSNASSANTGVATNSSITHNTSGVYYYRTKAVNSCGNSDWSNSVDLTVVASGPPYNVPSRYITIQSAIDAASSNDTINVSAGTYNETITLKQGMVLIGEDPETTIIDAGDSGTGILAYGITAATIKNLSVTNASSRGIHINPGASQGGTFTIENCRIYGNGSGVDLWNGVTSGNVTIKNSVIYDNTYNGVDNSGFRNTTLTNNTIADNGRSGYYDWVGAGSHVFNNNIIVNNGWYGITPHRNSPRTISYNNVWNNTKGSYYEGFSGDPTVFIPNPGTGEKSQDPKFVDSANGDYHLQESSPSIDTGDPASAFGNELTPNGSRINMGAYGNTSEATKGGSFSQSYSGPDTSSTGVELTNFSVSGSNKVGGTLNVQYTFRNTKLYSLDFSSAGIFVGSRNASGVNKDFGFVQKTLSPGESYTFSASTIVDSTGTWHFWPAYSYAGGWGPYMWHDITVSVTN
ncbi:right-handed parallel beta-helix repeat-containing protein [Patescibacteria group bacterium]|nr:right-handed parallel beta-helix repeat-containing protein [Patescibacteria group bacterium]